MGNLFQIAAPRIFLKRLNRRFQMTQRFHKGIRAKDAKIAADKIGAKTLPLDHPFMQSVLGNYSLISFLPHTPTPPVQSSSLPSGLVNAARSISIAFEVDERGRLFILGGEPNPDEEDGAYQFWSSGICNPDPFGIEIIEGDVPGSDYLAAHLTESIDFANAAAEKLRLDIRFFEK